MRINYIYGHTGDTDSEVYASITVDLDVLNSLKAMVEDWIVDYARVRNFIGIREAVNAREELMEAIEAICPQPIPEAEEQTDE